MRKLLILLLICASTAVFAQSKWTGTWATAVQFTTPDNMAKTEFTNNSIRQTIHVSLGGDVIRLQLSNAYGDSPLQIKSVYIADVSDSCSINTNTAKYLTFVKKRNVTIEAGKDVWSDEIKYDLKPLQRLSITINYAETPLKVTSHPGSRTTSYIIKGEAKPKTSFAKSERLEHWYNISAIDVMAENVGSIAVLGNSITDGRGSTTNKQNRWTDAMAEQLAAINNAQGVLNLGIGGNCVLKGGLGDPAVKRFDRDILAQSGITTLIIFEGVNDIGGSEGRSEEVAKQLIEAYKDFAKQAHERGIKVYGATITPFKYSQYDKIFPEAARQTVNEWIRKSMDFDAVIDFDELVRDPNDPSAIRKDLQEDWLHLNAKGYAEMGKFAAEMVSKPLKKRSF